jgi:phage tail-like protein
MPPPIGSFFKVKIGNFAEVDFQEVAGLSMTLETAALKEGGQNLFVHQLPVRTTCEKLVLKRALAPSSEVANWCKKALEEFSFRPQDIQISLRDFLAQDTILVQWYITHAYPVKWSVAGFNAMNNEVVIESIELQYQHFTKAFPS